MVDDVSSIEHLLSLNEGKTLEFKENTTTIENILKTVVAFSNTAGGLLVIGIKNRTKEVIGLKNILSEEERLANTISDRIVPSTFPNMLMQTYRNKDLLLVEVAWNPGSGPFYLKSEGKTNGTYVRFGSTNRKADSSIIESIERLKTNQHFDEMPCFDAKERDLDFDLGKKFITSRRWGKETPATMKLVSVAAKNKIFPTNGGILLLGIDKLRNDIFPNAFVRCGRFKGTTKSEILDQIDRKSVV